MTFSSLGAAYGAYKDSQEHPAPELLAPAGGWEQLAYAIRFGADAVYLATDKFGLRKRATNFSLEDLPQVVGYAHDHGVHVHVTVNAQMHRADFDDLPRYLAAIDEAGADAVLVSDLGALRMARQYAPHVQIHVSTQASVSNAQSALVWHELGASRIVCAREMSMEDIAAMREELPRELELEVFVHGAMCMAISGRCLISDYLTGRSATDGNCTQPCRWKYSLVEEKRPGEFFPVEEDERGSYMLNAKDMNMLAHLDELRRIGVDSVKIEGRNKRAFYVATVVNAYRQVLDGADPAAFAGELETVSHRPYGTGFYFGPAHQTPESDAYIRPYDWAFDVLECEPKGDVWRVVGLCRNRFWEGSELEVLAPHEPVRTCLALNVCHMPYEEVTIDERERPQWKPSSPQPLEMPVNCANRTMELYAFDIPFPVEPHTIFRIQRASRTTK